MKTSPTSAVVCGLMLLVGCTVLAQIRSDNKGQRAAFAPEDYLRWTKELSNWGRWGPADERGTLNLITAEKMKLAAALVKTGVSISLAELQVPNVDDPASPYSGKPYVMTMNLRDFEQRASKERFSSPPPEDLGMSAHGGRTHIDSLAHMFYEGRGYNGISYKEVTEKGAAKNAVDRMRSGIVTRGVLIDIPRLKKVPYLDSDARVYPADLDAWERMAGVKVSAGDALFVRVGHWARRKATGEHAERSAGLDPTVIPWLKARDVAVMGSEAVHDVMPNRDGLGPAPVHWFALTFLGMSLMDYLDLDQLSEVAAQQKRWEFLVVIAPMPIKGATGSPVNPIAVF